MAKRKCHYQDSWTHEFRADGIGPVKNNNWVANCKLCKSDFSIDKSGRRQLLNHIGTATHQRNKDAATTSDTMEKWTVRKNTSEETTVLAAELAYAYHCAKHHQSYLSLDCTIRLSCKLFNDSKLSGKMSCGRTKAAALAVNVVAPWSLERVVSELTNCDGNHMFFCVSTDASNHKDIKCFPVAVRYFDYRSGIRHRLIGFFDTPHETAEQVVAQLDSVLKDCNLDQYQYVSAYSADNANVNYGVRHSVYTLLREKIMRCSSLTVLLT
jgi:hypothetical protein